MSEGYGIREDGDTVLIRIPRDQVHSLRVALQPMRAGETVSASTQNFRDRLDKALAKVGK
ncbi:hypothetical protein [Salipiger bermudensis]|uniref:hypothetical protein n=1 Tax=Salipiger bermudensis TaxID=344736 RepID=UPI001CD1E1A2|nr:hypothetical protein [Salipiger bermudensis]MCA0961169.1 hypothetical protein [Salipiger bermudensis]